VVPVDPDDVPVIVFPPKSPTVLPSTTSTTIFNSRDPEFTGRPSGGTGTTGSSSGDDDPTTTAGGSGDVVLQPKVAVKTIPSARLLVDDGGGSPDGGQPSGAEVAVTDADGATRVVPAPAGGGASSEEASGPVATTRTGLTRSLSDSVSSPIGGLLVAALVSFVVAGAYCGWLLLARR